MAGQTLVDYDWFRNDLLKTITHGMATVTMAYDQANRLDTTTLANVIVQDFTLDGAGDITQISQDKVQHQAPREGGSGGGHRRLGGRPFVHPPFRR